MIDVLTNTLVLAAETSAVEGGGAAEEESSSFIVSPDLGLMIWTLLCFGIVLFVLGKWVFPRIGAILDERRDAIEESIKHAERTRAEADEIIAEYRQRLAEARVQAEDIAASARRSADQTAAEAVESAKSTREELLAQTKHEIATETQRALQDIRREVANLTVLATEKVTRKSLTADDQKRLVEEALNEVDFSALAGSKN